MPGHRTNEERKDGGLLKTRWRRTVFRGARATRPHRERLIPFNVGDDASWYEDGCVMDDDDDDVQASEVWYERKRWKKEALKTSIIVILASS